MSGLGMRLGALQLLNCALKAITYMCTCVWALANSAQPLPYYAMPAVLVNPPIMLSIMLDHMAYMHAQFVWDSMALWLCYSTTDIEDCL